MKRNKMSGFDQFSTQKKSHNALLQLLRETFVVGMEEMSKKLSVLFGAPTTFSKQQITQELYQREQDLKKQRMG